MKNITKKIKEAIGADVLWSLSDFYYLIEEIKGQSIHVNFWEHEENWATILCDGNPIGYLWCKYPLLLIKNSELKNLKASLLHYPYLIIVCVQDVNSKQLIIDRDNVLMDIFGAISYEVPISASDVWFETSN